MYSSRPDLYGRTEIYTDVEEITAENIVEILSDALTTHETNRTQIDYLFDYYKGKQDIIYKTKDVRPEINNIICENRANEIVAFKTGYLMGEPVQYVNRSGDDTLSESINLLNEYVFAEDKAAKDKELADWMHICGVGYRMVLPDSENNEDDAPFEIYTLDPRNAFIIKYSGLGEKPMVGVKYVVRTDNTTVYNCYTATQCFVVEDGDTVTETTDNPLGAIPIIEYKANTAMLGAFETVITMLDALNSVTSNRLDGIENFVEAFLQIKGVDIDDDDFLRLKEMGCIKMPAEGDAKYVSQELNQTQIQEYVNYMYNSILTICGMPSQGDGNTADSSNNGAVILRNGWQAAEARAKNTELMFKKSEKEFLKLALAITNTYRNLNLRLPQIEIRFTRRNYENISEKSQVLTTMLSNDKIHPRLAFEHCGMFVDPENAYIISEQYHKEQQETYSLDIDNYIDDETDAAKAEVNAAQSVDTAEDKIVTVTDNV